MNLDICKRFLAFFAFGSLSSMYIFSMDMERSAGDAAAGLNTITDTLVSKKREVNTLGEVVVEAENRKDIKEGMAFYPGKKEKKFSTNAIELLDMMALTELPYDIRKKTITDAAGNAVHFFIDGLPATQKELNAINTMDVTRVEYFPMSTDPAFQGQKNIVNFVLKKYSSGGYTKVDARQYAPVERGDYALSSRFVYKEMTYDVYAGGGYKNDHSLRQDINTNYKDIFIGGERYSSISERVCSESQVNSTNKFGAYLKANWSHDNINLTLTGGWDRERVPERGGIYKSVYNPDIFNSAGYESRQSSLGLSPYFRMNVMFTLPHSQVLSFSMSGTYCRSHMDGTYIPDNLDEIINSNRDTRKQGSLMASYSKTFDSKNSFNVLLLGSGEINNSVYDGSYDGVNRYKSVTSVAQATYSHTFSQGTYLSVSAGFENIHRNVGSNTANELNPTGDLSFRYKWNKKSTMLISTNIFTSGYFGNVLNDVIVHRKELEWLRGNPDLRERIWWQSVLSNTWNFSRQFALTGKVIYTHVFNHDVPVWEVAEGYDGVVEFTDDHATSRQFTAGINTTLRLFNRRLVISGKFDYKLRRLTGIYNRVVNWFDGSLSARWTANNWYLGVGIVPSVTSYYSIQKDYAGWRYSINLGYNYKDFNFKGMIYNPFGSKLGSMSYVSAAHFNQEIKNYSDFNANVFSLQVVYTVSYGKKVAKSNLSGSQILESGSLKF